MNEKRLDKRVLIFAILGMLTIRLLAWGAGSDATAHADRPNQTVPTPTPKRPTVKPIGTNCSGCATSWRSVWPTAIWV